MRTGAGSGVRFAGANNPPFAMRLQRMGHPAVDGPPGRRTGNGNDKSRARWRFTFPPIAMRLRWMGHPSRCGWLRYIPPKPLWLVERGQKRFTFTRAVVGWAREDSKDQGVSTFKSDVGLEQIGQKIWRKYGHYEETAGSSTATLAMKLREAPLRMTISISINQSPKVKLYVDTAWFTGGWRSRRGAFR